MNWVKTFQQALVKFIPSAVGSLTCVFANWDNNGNYGMDVSAYDFLIVSCQEDVHVVCDNSANKYTGTIPAFLAAGSNYFFPGGKTHLHVKNVDTNSDVFVTGYKIGS